MGEGRERGDGGRDESVDWRSKRADRKCGWRKRNAGVVQLAKEMV